MGFRRQEGLPLTPRHRTGPTHLDRSVAQIAVVDQYERLVLNVYVKPDQPVFSYLTALTGITKVGVTQDLCPPRPLLASPTAAQPLAPSGTD